MVSQTTFRVIDAFEGPHRGRILRLRLQSGDAPSVRSLKGARLRAVSPEGSERFARVDGFPLFGGRTSDESLRRTGRIDVTVTQEGSGDDQPAIAASWEVTAD
jgi:hypothetical protein